MGSFRPAQKYLKINTNLKNLFSDEQDLKIPKALYTHPETNKKIKIPETIFVREENRDKKLTFVRPKQGGLCAGGWYQDQNHNQFMVKIGGSNPYMEKLLNDLARICVGNEFIAEKTHVSHCEFEGQPKICFVTSIIPEFRDMNSIKGKNTTDTVAKRKIHAPKFHPLYVFNSLVAFDDTNGGNIGLGEDDQAKIIDYGILPSFLHSIQNHQAEIPFYLASLIGHHNPHNMQLLRRRYFGDEESSNPLDYQDSLETKISKEEDINYYTILSGIEKISNNKLRVLETIDKAITEIKSLAIDGKQEQGEFYINQRKQKRFLKQFSRFREAIEKRISWMEKNFKDDLENLENNKQEFLNLKWRMHSKFTELMLKESEIFDQCARKSSQSNLQLIAKTLGINSKNKKQILEYEVPSEKKEYLKELVNSSLALHNAVIINDIKLTQWLVENDIADINKERKSRKHNYQYFNLTPLGIAIAIYHDKLVYDTKNSEAYDEIIEYLAKKFFELNGEEFDKNTHYQGSKYARFEGSKSAVKVTFTAYKKYIKIRELLDR